jgi:tetratricopeptide (TPR) repeat protein
MARQKLQSRPRLTAALAVSMLLLAACAGPPVDPREIPGLAGYAYYPAADVELLRMTPEMTAFVNEHAGDQAFFGRYGRNGRAWSLAYAALDPYLLAFDYDPMITLPADQAFAQKRGNCLTFSSMFVAMAREAGLNAWFQEVKIPPIWNSVNDTMLVGKHVNAVVQDKGRSYTVDISLRTKKAMEEVKRLSDTEAKGQFFNNLGVDALIANDLPTAYTYFRKSLEVLAGQDYVWSNLGVVFRRNGQTDEALFAYKTALLYEPQQAVALNNIYTIYEENGNVEAASEFARKVEKNRQRNPYYLHYMAEVANHEARYEDAIPLLERAIRLKSSEYRFYYTLAQSQHRLGKPELARASLDRAIELAPGKLEDGPLSLPN